MAPTPTLLPPLLLGLVPVAWFVWRRRVPLREASWPRRAGVAVLCLVAWGSFAGGAWQLLFAEGDRRARWAHARRRSVGGKVGLAGLHACEHALFQEKDRYTDAFDEAGFSTDREDPFTYTLGRGLLRADGGPPVDPTARCRFSGQWPDGTPLAPGLHGACPDCQVAALAAHVTPEGDTVCWSVATVARQGPAGEVPAGVVVAEPAR